MGLPQSLAERYRQHRIEFTFAQENGCTPREARSILHKRKRADDERRWRERRAELSAREADPRAGHDDTPPDSTPYWQRS